MAFDITPYIDKKPSEVRKLIREGVIDFPTAGPEPFGASRSFSACTRLISSRIVFSLKLTLVTVVNSPSIISRHVSALTGVSPSVALASPMSAPVSSS